MESEGVFALHHSLTHSLTHSKCSRTNTLTSFERILFFVSVSVCLSLSRDTLTLECQSVHVRLQLFSSVLFKATHPGFSCASFF